MKNLVDIMRLCNLTVEENEGLIKERLRWGGVWRRGGMFLGFVETIVGSVALMWV